MIETDPLVKPVLEAIAQNVVLNRRVDTRSNLVGRLLGPLKGVLVVGSKQAKELGRGINKDDMVFVQGLRSG